MRKDPVTPEVRQAVLARDGFRCVAPRIDPRVDDCRTTFGHPMQRVGHAYRHDELQVDHVKDQPAMGVRAPSDPAHLVTLCPHHHLDGWATANRPLLREYLTAARGSDEGSAVT